jgi:multidrug efflux pump subunit AcrB
MAAMVFLTAPLGLIGAVPILLLFGQPFGFNAILGANRPILTAMAAVLAFIPLTTSVLGSAMAYTLMGGMAVGTILTLIFLPALVRSASPAPMPDLLLPPWAGE